MLKTESGIYLWKCPGRYFGNFILFSKIIWMMDRAAVVSLSCLRNGWFPGFLLFVTKTTHFTQRVHVCTRVCILMYMYYMYVLHCWVFCIPNWKMGLTNGTCMYIYVCTCMHMYVCTCTCMTLYDVCIHVCMYVCTTSSMHMHTCMHNMLYMYVCVCTCMVELTIKCTHPGRCNFLTKHSRAYSLQQCSRLSLRYV